MARYEDDIRWITIHGNHIPIKPGQSVQQAISERFDNTDDIEIDIELEDEDVKMPYEKKYYINTGTEWSPRYKLINEDEIDKYFEMGKEIHEIDINDEMNQKMNELIEKYAPTNTVGLMIREFDNYLRYNSSLNYNERKLLAENFRQHALDVCANEAEKWLDKLPKNENKSVDGCCMDTNHTGYIESQKAPYNSKEYDYYTSNCQRCIIAYEMRRRGYNVEANKYKGRTDEIYNTRLSLNRAFLNYDYFINTKSYDTQPSGEKYSSRGALIKAMERDMKSEGEGARFVLSWDWKNSRWGHTVNAEVINGEVKIIDAQVNRQYSIKDIIDRKDLRATTLKCTRVDNLKLSNRLEDIIKWKK